MLELWQEDDWKVPGDFPLHVRNLCEQKRDEEAAATYQEFLAGNASLSLSNYVTAIVHHVLPLMQTARRLTRITAERIADAGADGVVGFELRFAPQLHTSGGLSLSGVMEAVIEGISGSPFPVRLMVCVLRHEDEAMAARLADLAIAYKEHVGVFDLAGDERANPGVLKWWAGQAMRVREHGIDVDIHLWETDEPRDEDLKLLGEYNLQRLGHGFRGERQEGRLLEVCPSSNIVTGQVKSFSAHPVDRLFRQGRNVTINTDGTLFTRSDLSNEYQLLNRYFGWGYEEFFIVNKRALEFSSFPESAKKRLLARLEDAYRQKIQTTS